MSRHRAALVLALIFGTLLALPASSSLASVSAGATVTRSDGLSCSFNTYGNLGSPSALTMPINYGTTITCNGPLKGTLGDWLRPNTETHVGDVGDQSTVINDAKQWSPSVTCDNGRFGPWPSSCNSGQGTWKGPNNPVSGTYTYDVSGTVAIDGLNWASYPTGSTDGRYACQVDPLPNTNAGVLVCGVDWLTESYPHYCVTPPCITSSSSLATRTRTPGINPDQVRLARSGGLLHRRVSEINARSRAASRNRSR
jgi:hypothetical protein